MITLFFSRGSAIRRVFIDGRVITLLDAAVGNVPIIIDLDKIDEKQIKERMGEEGMKFIREIALLKTDEEIVQDIKRDFQSVGWRLYNRQDDSL